MLKFLFKRDENDAVICLYKEVKTSVGHFYFRHYINDADARSNINNSTTKDAGLLL